MYHPLKVSLDLVPWKKEENMERVWSMVKVEKGLSLNRRDHWGSPGDLAESNNQNLMWYQKLVEQIDPGLRVSLQKQRCKRSEAYVRE